MHNGRILSEASVFHDTDFSSNVSTGNQCLKIVVENRTLKRMFMSVVANDHSDFENRDVVII